MNSLLSIEELISAVNGRIIIKSSPAFFTSAATDSRAVTEHSLFVPLIGENQDGHKYIAQAAKNGASVILAASASRALWQPFISSISSKADAHKVTIIEVDNTLHALQKAAAAYIDKFPALIKIGITGSNGKTTVKEMARAVLCKKYKTAATKGNLNSETGVPLSVFSLLNMDAPPEAAVFEMGMNRAGEIAESTAVVRPGTAIITNIGTAHIGILGSKDAIAKEKKEIFAYAKKCFIPYNESYAPFLMEGLQADFTMFGGGERIGGGEAATLVKDCGLDGLDMRAGKSFCHLLLPGMHNYFNACAAIALGRYFEVPDEDIAAALSSLCPIEGRSSAIYAELKNGAKARIVRDYYNANPSSMKAALDVCRKTKCNGKRIYVLGDMKEGDGEASHRELGRQAASSDADILILIGDEARFAYEEAAKMNVPSHFVQGAGDEAMKKAASIILGLARDDDLILLKASRSLMLERVETLLTGGGGQ